MKNLFENNGQSISAGSRGWAVIGMIAFIVLGGWQAITKTIINSDMQQFMHEQSTGVQVSNIDPLKILNAINQQNSGLFLLALEGGSQQQRATASINLRKKLLQNDAFTFVNNGSNSLAKKDKEILKQYRYLLSSKNTSEINTANPFSEINLAKSFKQRYQELLSPLGGVFKKTLSYDPTAEIRFILKQWQLGKEPSKIHSVWFSRDTKVALLVAGINIKGSDINTQQHALNTIKQTFTDMNTAIVKLSMTGTGVFAVQARDKIKADSQRISIVASLGVMLLMFFAFRSLWLVFLAVIPLLSAIISGVIVTQLIFGSIQGITLAFGLTLIGVALDYPVHIFSHIVNSENIKLSVKNIWPTMRLGVITTSLGFVALTQTSFNGLEQLGVFAISGLLVAALITRYVMPNLILLRAIRSEQNVPEWIKHICKISIPFNKICVLLIITLACILALSFPVQWENDLAKLSPISLEQLKLDKKLRKQLKADDLVNVAIVRAEDSNAVIKKTEQLSVTLDAMVADNTIASYRAPHQLLPSIERQVLRQQQLPDKKILQQRITKAVRNSHFKSNSFNDFINDVEKSKTLTPLDTQKLKGTLFDKQLSSMLYKQQDDWFAVIRFVGVRDSLALKKVIDNLADSDIKYLNIKHVSQSIIDDFRNEAVNLIAIGLVVILITLIFSLRNTQRLLRVSFIVSMALVFDILLLNILGQALSLFHLISLLLVIGLGLDYSLFFTRPNGNKASRERTAYGILVCFGSTALVFGMLAVSSIPVLSAIGLTVFIGVSFCFLFATLFSEKSLA